MKDRYAYERAMLRFMLTARTREGLPVVWAETLLREFVDDLGAGMQCYQGDPGEIAAWAMGEGEGMGSEPQRLCCHIDVAYRIMVGAFSLGYHPDWLCVPPSPRLGHPRFPAWVRHGGRWCEAIFELDGRTREFGVGLAYFAVSATVGPVHGWLDRSISGSPVQLGMTAISGLRSRPLVRR